MSSAVSTTTNRACYQPGRQGKTGGSPGGSRAPGIAGLARVASAAYPDETQFDKKGKYFDPKASRENPRWMLVDVKLAKKTRLLSLAEMRANPLLESMVVLQRGNRLSITPVDPAEWKFITGKLMKASR